MAILFFFTNSKYNSFKLHPQGFGDRLLAEVKRLAPRDVKVRVSFILILLIQFSCIHFI